MTSYILGVLISVYHDVRDGVEKVLDGGVDAGLGAQLVPEPLPDDLLETTDVLVVDPDPDVGRLHHQSWQPTDKFTKLKI